MQDADLYEVLGSSPSDSVQQLRYRYQQLVLQVSSPTFVLVSSPTPTPLPLSAEQEQREKWSQVGTRGLDQSSGKVPEDPPQCFSQVEVWTLTRTL